MLNRIEKANFIYQTIVENEIWDIHDPRLVFPNGKSVCSFINTWYSKKNEAQSEEGKYLVQTILKAKEALKRNEKQMCLHEIYRLIEQDPFISLSSCDILLPNRQKVENFWRIISSNMKKGDWKNCEDSVYCYQIKVYQKMLKINYRFNFLEQCIIEDANFSLSYNDKTFPDGTGCAYYYNRYLQELKKKTNHNSLERLQLCYIKKLLILTKEVRCRRRLDELQQAFEQNPHFCPTRKGITMSDGIKFNSFWQSCISYMKRLRKNDQPLTPFETYFFQTFTEIENIKRTLK